MFRVYLSLRRAVPFVESAKTQIKSHNQQKRTNTLKRRRIPEQSRTEKKKKNHILKKFSAIQIENEKNKYHESENFEIKLEYQQATKMIFAGKK